MRLKPPEVCQVWSLTTSVFLHFAQVSSFSIHSKQSGSSMKTAVSKQREIARLISLDFSNRKIGEMLEISPTTVGEFRRKLQASGKNHDELKSLDDFAFSTAVGTRPQQYQIDTIIPDWAQVQEELRGDVTLSLLWQEYLETNKPPSGKCLSYSQFQRRFRAWLKTKRISMRQFHLPGDKMFVDFCGKTMPVFNLYTGEEIRAQFFVAVLGGSSYMFVYATSGQTTNDWLKCHIEAFKFFGGVPRQVVTDNLKAAIIKNTKKGVIANLAFEACAEHYGFQISPTRVRKPKDKALAEVGVQIVQRWILARLRKRKFFGLDELNQAIMECLEILNKKETKSYRKSRQQRFEEVDRPALRPLPDHEYDISSWVYQVRVPEDYHIKHGESYYSVPHQYSFHKVDLRITQTTIDVMLNRQCIASHSLRDAPGQSTVDHHMPEEHYQQRMHEPSSLIKWAGNIGPSVKEWTRKNLEERKDFANGHKSVRDLQNWVREEQCYDKLDAACAMALEYNILPFQRLKGIITNLNVHKSRMEAVICASGHSNIRGSEYYSQTGGSRHAE